MTRNGSITLGLIPTKMMMKRLTFTPFCSKFLCVCLNLSGCKRKILIYYLAFRKEKDDLKKGVEPMRQ